MFLLVCMIALVVSWSCTLIRQICAANLHNSTL
jgi:hypothetical protein